MQSSILSNEGTTLNSGLTKWLKKHLKIVNNLVRQHYEVD